MKMSMQIEKSAQLEEGQNSHVHIACLVCVENIEFVNYFNELVAQHHLINTLVRNTNIDGLIESLKSHQKRIDILILEIPDHPDEDGLFKSLDALSHHIHRHTRIFGLSKAISSATRNRLIELGFEECFAGVADHELLGIITSSSQTSANYSEDILIAITGLTGGVGASLIALNFAHQITQTNRHHSIILNARSTGHSYRFLLGKINPEQFRSIGTYEEIQISDQVSIFESLKNDDFRIPDADELRLIRSGRLVHPSTPCIFILDCDSSSPILDIADHVVLVAEPDFKNLNALADFKSNFQRIFKKTTIILNKIQQNDRIEFDPRYFSVIDGVAPIELYRFAPKAISAALASKIPILSDDVLSDRDAYSKLMTALGVTVSAKRNTTLILTTIHYIENLIIRTRNFLK